MSTLAAAVEDYLRVRRALGYKLARSGRQLLQFVAYLEQASASTVTIEQAIAWATQPAGGDCNYWCDRLSVVRQFSRSPSACSTTTPVIACRERGSAPSDPEEQVDELMGAVGRAAALSSVLTDAAAGSDSVDHS